MSPSLKCFNIRTEAFGVFLGAANGRPYEFSDNADSEATDNYRRSQDGRSLSRFRLARAEWHDEGEHRLACEGRGRRPGSRLRAQYARPCAAPPTLAGGWSLR